MLFYARRLLPWPLLSGARFRPTKGRRGLFTAGLTAARPGPSAATRASGRTGWCTASAPHRSEGPDQCLVTALGRGTRLRTSRRGWSRSLPRGWGRNGGAWVAATWATRLRPVAAWPSDDGGRRAGRPPGRAPPFENRGVRRPPRGRSFRRDLVAFPPGDPITRAPTLRSDGLAARLVSCCGTSDLLKTWALRSDSSPLRTRMAPGTQHPRRRPTAARGDRGQPPAWPRLAERDPAKTRVMLGELQTEATSALEDPPDLARGIYPPLLADGGPPAALEAQARKSPVPVTVTPDGVGRCSRRSSRHALLRCPRRCRTAKWLRMRTTWMSGYPERAHELAFEVIDDGEGFDQTSTQPGTGLQGMADRLEAIGGLLEVRSRPGMGTTVTGRVPV